MQSLEEEGREVRMSYHHGYLLDKEVKASGNYSNGHTLCAVKLRATFMETSFTKIAAIKADNGFLQRLFFFEQAKGEKKPAQKYLIIPKYSSKHPLDEHAISVGGMSQ